MTLSDTDLAAVTRATNRTPFFIFNLFADYLLPYKDGRAWTQDLVYLLGLLGLSERAARTTLSRMKGQGWFRTVREGRRSRYELTEKGRAILIEGDKRIFEEPKLAWDGRWQMVVYSLPEEQRSRRNELRTKLKWFGFGRLAPGTWVAAHDRTAEIEAIVARLAVQPYVDLFQAQAAGGLSDAAVVAKCWQLEALAAEYEAFCRHWRPRLTQFCNQLPEHSLAEQFTMRFWLTFAFQPFPRRDPNLPRPLLPADWPGHEARTIFNHYRACLGAEMATFLAQLPV